MFRYLYMLSFLFSWTLEGTIVILFWSRPQVDSLFGDEIAQSILPKPRRDPLDRHCAFLLVFLGQMFKKQRLCERKDRFIRWPIGAKWSNAKMPRENNTENHNIGMEWSWNMVQRVDTVYVLHKKKKCVSDGEPVGCHENNFPRESESLKRKIWSNDPLPLSDTEIWTST